MPNYTPSPKFQQAASFLSNGPSASKASVETKLELYGLYKYLTVSRTPNTSRPGFFDMSGKAKWDAWSNAGKTYDCEERAEERYLQIAHDFGWKEGDEPVPETAKPAEHPDVDLDNLDDSDGDQPPSPNAGSGEPGGMGIYVSSMAPPEASTSDFTIHGLALSDDTTALMLLLQSDPDIDVNEPDEFGYTPLHLAADRGNSKVVEYLLKHGADASKKDSDEFTAFELAEAAGHEDVVALLKTAA
ncbi:hypothetical protein HGRIS_008026 [Hohenbuehelia grisea]|uniref:ACB domain-containing protein n=1 Tax=Hohenbuehelia grisea TaxID=104357 RepID=A0ABR3J6P6_9AGAR